MMGRRSAPFERFARRAKPRRRANSLRPSTKNRAPRHALRVWAGAASQNLGQRRILIKSIKASGVLLLLAAPRRGPHLCWGGALRRSSVLPAGQNLGAGQIRFAQARKSGSQTRTACLGRSRIPESGAASVYQFQQKVDKINVLCYPHLVDKINYIKFSSGQTVMGTANRPFFSL